MLCNFYKGKLFFYDCVCLVLCVNISNFLTFLNVIKERRFYKCTCNFNFIRNINNTSMDNNFVRDASTAAIAIVICGNVAELVQIQRKKRESRPKRWWVRSIFTEQSRSRYGAHNLISEMRLSDDESFFNYHRMSPASFDKLLSKIGPTIVRQDTNYRTSINPSTRLSLTVRYLAGGNSQVSLSYAFRLGKSTVCNILQDTLVAIHQCLRNEVISVPTESNWLANAEGFKRRWNFPNCIGAIDGKHIEIKAPPGTGSEYYNYKQFFSIILLAVCDYRYRFVFMDVGSQGRDGGVFKDSELERLLACNGLNVPGESEIFKDGPVLPYYLLGDEAFGLKSYMMTPFAGKSTGKLDYEKCVFNYRQSRARRVIENAFGVLVARWRILKTSLETSTETVDKIVQAAVCLHNYCLIEEESSLPHQYKYCPRTLLDEENLERNEIRLGD